MRDWGEVVRKNRKIPTRLQYSHYGKYSVGTFENHFGSWSAILSKFREFAQNKLEWEDVLALLPNVVQKSSAKEDSYSAEAKASTPILDRRYSRLDDRPIYGDPINFRGLRHEPVNENGVVFLFGMVARELGFLVEAVQAGFPDCEAKRQISAGKWQRVRIEFEFESRNFRDHGHSIDGCDIIVCWRHNWRDCPAQLEVVELSSLINSLGKSEE